MLETMELYANKLQLNWIISVTLESFNCVQVNEWGLRELQVLYSKSWNHLIVCK